MDTIRTTLTKKTKPKKKNTSHPVKVVYISNPMKIKTSASQFRALVQELTGQDAESPPDPTRFHALHPDSSSDNTEDDILCVDCVVPPSASVTAEERERDFLLRCRDDDDEGQQQQPSSMESYSFEALDDDVFTPQMIENISALLPTSVFYESPHLSHW